MNRFVAMTTVAILAASAASARDPLAPLDTPTVEFAGASSPRSVDDMIKPNAFGSVALPAGVTIYDARFRRVAKTDASAPEVVSAAASLRGLAQVDQLARVKQMVGNRVRFMSDPDSMKVADLWANAGETLQNGRGDDEDIAIAEMQILKAAGYSPRDLFLTVGKHSTQGAHIVLIARTPQGFYMLDNLQAAPVSVDSALASFRPTVSVGEGGSWVHGYRRGYRTASLR